MSDIIDYFFVSVVFRHSHPQQCVSVLVPEGLKNDLLCAAITGRPFAEIDSERIRIEHAIGIGPDLFYEGILVQQQYTDCVTAKLEAGRDALHGC